MRDIFRRLMDAVDPSLVDAAESGLQAIPGVVAVRRVRMRWIGHEIHADAHLDIDSNISLADAHDLAHAAEHHPIHAVPNLTGAVVHAYPEKVRSTAGSVGVILAGWLVTTTGDSTWDTVVAVAIGLFVAVRAVGLGRQVLAVLGQHVPEGMAIELVAADLAAVHGVTEVHDLHVWTLTSGMHVATAHLVRGDGGDPQAVLDAAREVLRVRHQVAHATLLVESTHRKECHELDW